MMKQAYDNHNTWEAKAGLRKFKDSHSCIARSYLHKQNKGVGGRTKDGKKSKRRKEQCPRDSSIRKSYKTGQIKQSLASGQSGFILQLLVASARSLKIVKI